MTKKQRQERKEFLKERRAEVKKFNETGLNKSFFYTYRSMKETLKKKKEL
jgi:hypothetical protein